MIEVITSISLWELIKHSASWINNLKRAKDKRKKESVEALRKVIVASRKTRAYVRLLKDKGTGNRDFEIELTTVWTELGFALEDLKINKLAERCQIKGKNWSDPDHQDRKYLDKSDTGLEKMELLARDLLLEINK
ncbi:MAG: hypothetical protein GY760_13915 [Deltaproteobacteria bacterium]|nr:hypothetical protein [Deltaproteobacteria bacterium]